MWSLRIILFPDLVDKDPCCIDRYLSSNLICLSGLGILNERACKLFALLIESEEAHVVEHGRSVIVGSSCKRKRHSSIVKLPVVVNDAALEIVGLYSRNDASRFGCVQNARVADGRAAREQIVKF